MPPSLLGVASTIAGLKSVNDDYDYYRIVVGTLIIILAILVVYIIWRKKSRSYRCHWTDGSIITDDQPIGEKQDFGDDLDYLQPKLGCDEEIFSNEQENINQDGKPLITSGKLAAIAERQKAVEKDFQDSPKSTRSQSGPWRRDSYPIDTIAQKQADHVENCTDESTGRMWRRRTLHFASDEK